MDNTIGEYMYGLAEELFPINLGLTGPDMLLLLLKALISISAPFSPTRLTS